MMKTKVPLFCYWLLLISFFYFEGSVNHVAYAAEPSVKPIKNIQVGSRPYYLVNKLNSGALKRQLEECKNKRLKKTDFSIGHRGAPLQYPEHTKESYVAAARMGAGVLECDVTFTKDKALVCRHSQCDLHATTNILSIPSLAKKCSIPFSPANAKKGIKANAMCCTSDITLAEFKTLKGKMDGVNDNAVSVKEYIAGTPSFRTDLYSDDGTLMTHAESIQLFKSLKVKMTPELKSPQVNMPFDGFTQQDYASKMLNEYIQAKVPKSHVFPQSFNLTDIKYWIKTFPEFGNQAVFLDERDAGESFDPMVASTWNPSMEQLVNDGVKILAPPIWMLVTTNQHNQVVPSEYAKRAKSAGLKLIAWTLERSTDYTFGGGWYYQSVKNAVTKDADILVVLDVLAKDVGVSAVFSDWPATTSYYANCVNL